MDPILKAAHEERERLQRVMAESEARLKEIDAFLRTYSTLSTRLTGVVATAEVGTLGVVIDHEKPASIKEKIIEIALEELRRNQPLHTRNLVAEILARGIALNGKDQVLQVSAVLSRDSRFVANRSIGWTLANPTKGEGPDVGASEPSISRREPLSTAPHQGPQP